MAGLPKVYEGTPDPDAKPTHQGRYYGRKVIYGVEHKICTGPGHDVPTWLPANDKYFYVFKNAKGKKPGALTARCRLCNNWAKLKSPGESGKMIPVKDVKSFFIEARNRIGIAELQRRTGIDERTIMSVINGKQPRVQRKTVRKLMLELISIRRKGEVYHKDDLRFGLHNPRRKRPLKKPRSRHDFYKQTGDDDLELRARSRRRHAEQTSL